MGIQNGLNFSRVDVETKADDEILGASDNEEKPILKAGKIAGVKPAFGIDCGGGFLGRAIVAFHDVRPTHPQFTHFSREHWLTIRSTQSGFPPRNIGPAELSLRGGASTLPCATLGEHSVMP